MERLPIDTLLARLKHIHSLQAHYTTGIMLGGYLTEIINPLSPGQLKELEREAHTSEDLLQFLREQTRAYAYDWREDIPLSPATQARLFTGEVVKTLHMQGPSLISLGDPTKVDIVDLLGRASAAVFVEGSLSVNQLSKESGHLEPLLNVKWIYDRAKFLRKSPLDPHVRTLLATYTRLTLPSSLTEKPKLSP